MTALAGWVSAFVFTQAIEIPIYVAALRGRRPLFRAALIAFGASAITHPVVWFAMPIVADAAFAAMARREIQIVHEAWFRWIAFGAIAEGFAIGVEALYLRAIGAPRPWLWAAVANLASASAGYVSFRFTGFP